MQSRAMINKKISIIVPVYNISPDYLKICIDSILSQSYRNIELIVVNDGSTNGCHQVIESCAKVDDRLIYILQENAGVSVARNNGLDHASGDYIVFVDGDDYLSEGILGHLMETVEDETDLLLFGYYTTYTNREMTRVLKSVQPELMTSEALQLAILRGDSRLGPVEVGAPWGKLIKRQTIENAHVRYTPGLKKGQDTVFTLHLLQQCRVIRYEQVAGYHYRMSTASVSHRFNPEIVDIMEKTLKAYEDFAAVYNKDERFTGAIKRKYYRVLLGEYLELLFLNKNNPKSEKQCQQEYRAILEREPYAQVIASMEHEKMSTVQQAEYKLIKNKRLKLLWAEKRMLGVLRGIVVRNYA